MSGKYFGPALALYAVSAAAAFQGFFDIGFGAIAAAILITFAGATHD